MKTAYQGCSVRATFLFLIVFASPLWPAPGVECTPQFLEFGECSYTTKMPGLEMDKFAGVWFTQKLVPSEYSQIESCSMTNFTWKGDYMKAVERGLNDEDRKIRQNFYVRPSPPPNEGEYLVEAEGVPAAPFQIISTDYKNYACAYSCLSLMGFRASYIWMYTRQPFPDPSHLQKCEDILTEKEIDLTHIEPMEQDESCPYMAKLPGIKSYMKSLMSQWKFEDTTVKPTTTAKPITRTTTVQPTTLPRSSTTTTTTTTTMEPEVVSNDVTFVEEEIEHLEDLEGRVLEEEAKLQREMEEERRRQEEERRRMEEERQREEEERRRMEEERRREEEEMRRLEEERRRMEDERTRLEEERRLVGAEAKQEEEDLRELRQDVRAEIRRNHRGNRHRQGSYVEESTPSSTSSLSFSFSTLVIALLSALSKC